MPEKDNAKRVHFLTIHTALTSIGFCASAFIIHFYVNINWTMQHLCILAIVCSTISYAISASVAVRSIAYENIKTNNLSGLHEFFAILKTPSVYFILLIFLNAFIYMAAVSLQTTFAELKKIDYIIFFGCWWLALIVPRLTCSKILSHISPYLCISFFTLFMIVGAWLLLWVEDNSILYVLSALILGTGYGLAYVFTKTEAIHYVVPSLRPSVLIYFGLAYFLGIYLGTFCASLIASYISYTALWLTLVAIGFVCYFIVIYFYQVAYKKYPQEFIS